MRNRIPGARNAEITEVISFISRNDRKKIFLVVIFQVSLSALDLIGVGIIGLIGAISITGVQSKPAGTNSSKILSFLNLSKSPIQDQVLSLGLLAVVLFVVKTCISLFVIRKITQFLSDRAAQISSELVQKFLHSGLLSIQLRSVQESLFALTNGVSNLTVGALAGLVNVIADASLLIFLAIGLFIVDPFISIATFLVFSLIGVVLYLAVHKRAVNAGEKFTTSSVKSIEVLNEAMRTYREALVKNRVENYIQRFRETRYTLSGADAEIRFLPQVGKYVIEVSMVLSFLLIGYYQFKHYNAAHAVGMLSLFIAATSRIAPAILRVQQGIIQLRSNVSAAGPTIDIAKLLADLKPALEIEYEENHLLDDFKPEIAIRNVGFMYPGSEAELISNLNLKILPNQHIAIIGPSGSGKTTLVDLILGILEPSTGEITISGLPPKQALKRYPGQIGYVPQDTEIFAGTLKSNICLGFSEREILDSKVEEVLEIASAMDFVNLYEKGVHSEILDRGSNLSGGQRQRIGIARALITNPKIIVFDEATSSLDSDTENSIVNSIEMLKKIKSMTIITIAHRLSTVKNADIVYYLENGNIIAHGRLEEVQSLVPTLSDSLD